MNPRLPLNAALTAVQAVVEDTEALPHLDLSEQLDALADAKALIDATQQFVKSLVAVIGDAVGGRFERHLLTLPDGRVIEYHPGNRRVFDRDSDDRIVGLLRAIATVERQVDPETGEIEDAAHATSRVLLEAARMEWRSSVLRRYGIDPDKFSDWRTGTPQVRVTAGDR